MQAPLVSVIIPCFNASASLRRCLESVISQDYPSLEIICVDDGSKDNTADIARRFDGVHVVRQANQGACVARNRGIAECSGEYVKFLDSDDFLFPGVIGHQVEIAKALPMKAVTYGDYVIWDEQGKRLINTALLHRSSLFSVVLQDIMTSTPLHHRQLLLAVGGFDVRLRRGQEWNLHVRLAASGVVFVHDPKPIYTYCNFKDPNRVSQYSLQSRSAKYNYKITQTQITADALERSEYPLRELAAPAFARRLWSAGRDAVREGESGIADECFERALEYCSSPDQFLPYYYRIPSRLVGRMRWENLLLPQTIGRTVSRIERALWRRL